MYVDLIWFKYKRASSAIEIALLALYCYLSNLRLSLSIFEFVLSAASGCSDRKTWGSL